MEEVPCPLCGIPPRLFAVDHQGFHLSRLQDGIRQPKADLGGAAGPALSAGVFPLPGGEQQIARTRKLQYKRQLYAIERIVGGKGRILDIGCGDGAFFAFARDEGWEIAGSDVRLSSRARKLSCLLGEGDLGQVDFKLGPLDAIRFNHVLEHT